MIQARLETLFKPYGGSLIPYSLVDVPSGSKGSGGAALAGQGGAPCWAGRAACLDAWWLCRAGCGPLGGRLLGTWYKTLCGLILLQASRLVLAYTCMTVARACMISSCETALPSRTASYAVRILIGITASEHVGRACPCDDAQGPLNSSR